MRESHLKAIEYAKENDAIISFDPNIRLMLWKSEISLKNAIQQFIPLCHILKISSDELEFITGCKDIKDALPLLFQGTVELIIYTKAKDGAEAYTKLHSDSVDGIKVSNVVDTTGAGDSFIGAFIACLLNDNVTDLNNIADDKLYHYLDVANKYAACTTCRQGALGAMATMDEFEEFCKEL